MVDKNIKLFIVTSALKFKTMILPIIPCNKCVCVCVCVMALFAGWWYGHYFQIAAKTIYTSTAYWINQHIFTNS